MGGGWGGEEEHVFPFNKLLIIELVMIGIRRDKVDRDGCW